MSVRRYDASVLQKGEPTPSGGIKVPANVTRVGVLNYRTTDGQMRRELRAPEEVFSKDSLASLAHAPVTEGHPSGPITADNWRANAIGHVDPNVAVQDPHVVSNLLIQDGSTIKKIDAGDLKEVSCGYNCDLESTGGVWNGQPFDAIQRNIRYNHVALGPPGWGRAGSSVALRLDSADAIQIEGISMKTERIDGVDYEVGSTAWEQARKRRQDSRDAALAQLKADLQIVTKDKDTAIGRADAAEAQVKKLTADLVTANDPKTVAARVDARARLINQAEKIYAKNGKRFDSLRGKLTKDGTESDAGVSASSSTDEMLVELVKEMDPSIDLKGKTPDYIQGLFSAMIKMLLKDEASEPVSDALPPPDETTNSGSPMAPGSPPVRDSIFDVRGGNGANQRADAKQATDPYDSEAARKRMVQDSHESFRQPMRRTVQK